ncbi:MAG: acyl carrier protein [Ruminococcaceae bacterium]|nr:acyl carrier protein [Oscillospiraceae bacterium]
MIMYEQLKTLLIEEMQIEEDKIAPEAELVNDLGFNSLELAELVIHCEETFDIEVDEEIAKDFVTVNDVVKYLEELTA